MKLPSLFILIWSYRNSYAFGLKYKYGFIKDTCSILNNEIFLKKFIKSISYI